MGFPSPNTSPMSVPHPVASLLNNPAGVSDMYFSTLHHYVRVINISFYLQKLLLAATYVKL